MTADPTRPTGAPAPTADASASPSKTKTRKVDYTGVAVLDLVEDCVSDASSNTNRADRDKQDFLNALYDRGGPQNMYVIWDEGTNRWVERGTDPAKGGLPAWMARPVTNLFSNKIDGIVAIQNQSEPTLLVKPVTDDAQDQATADVGDTIVRTLEAEIDFDFLRGNVNRAVTLMDKVAIVLWYDNDEKWGKEAVLALQCQACQEFALPNELPEGSDTCPKCDGPMQPAIDPANGNPIGLDLPIGRMRGSFYTTFEFSLPSSARSHRAEDNPWVLFHARLSWEEADREFHEHLEKLKAGGGWMKSSPQRHFADSYRKLSSPRSTQRTGSVETLKDGPVVYRLYHDPIETEDYYFPEGLLAVVSNGQILEAGALPFAKTRPDGSREPFKNVEIRTFRPTPGSQFGKPPADDLVSLQYQYCLVEALLVAILLHNSAPTVFLPMSVSLEKPLTGTPGETVPYRSTDPGAAPIFRPGMNPPEGLYKYLDLLSARMDQLSKLNAIMQGQRPEGNPTLGEIQVLKERGESAFAEVFREMTRFHERIDRMLLWIARDTVWTERARQVMGDNKRWEVEKWSAADLTGDVDVHIDPATAWPKSPLMKRLNLQELMGMGVFQLLQTNPELAGKILEFYDVTDFLPSLDVDRMQIARVLDTWRAATTPAEIAPPDPVLQNLPLHLQRKLEFLKTEDAEDLAKQNPPVFEAMKAHVAQITQLLAQQAAATMAAQQPQVPGAPAKPASPLDDLVTKGVLTPADAAGAAQPPASAGASAIDDLINQKVMRPAMPGEELEGAGAMPPGATR